MKTKTEHRSYLIATHAAGRLATKYHCLTKTTPLEPDKQHCTHARVLSMRYNHVHMYTHICIRHTCLHRSNTQVALSCRPLWLMNIVNRQPVHVYQQRTMVAGRGILRLSLQSSAHTGLPRLRYVYIAVSKSLGQLT